MDRRQERRGNSVLSVHLGDDGGHDDDGQKTMFSKLPNKQGNFEQLILYQNLTFEVHI